MRAVRISRWRRIAGPSAMRRWPLLLLSALLPSAVSAADVTVSLHGPSGAPLAGVVMTIYPATSVAMPPPDAGGPYVMAQRNIQFAPFMLIVPVGATVQFPNFDPVRHQVYSFSPPKKFTLKLYGRDQTRSVVFDKAGVVALGCNIHDAMIGFIKVVDTPFAALSNVAGEVSVTGLPPGPATIRLWHPYLKAPGNESSFTVTLPASGGISKTATLTLREPPHRASY